MGFESFLGNAHAVSAVREMLSRDAVPGSLLFAGPEGVGKKTLAMMLARALNCERLKANFCGECSPCRKANEMLTLAEADLSRRREMKDAARRVEGMVYFDLQLIEPITRFILIEQIRQLRAAAYARPFELRRRIFIIDQAQTIHWQAVDLLLKVMEEPPETTTFILICPNLHELRPTLRSRCHKVQFHPVEEEVIQTQLEKEKKLTGAQLALAARVAAGSIAAARNFNFSDFERRRQPWIAFLDGIAAKPHGSMTPAGWKSLFDSAKALAENRSETERTLKMGYTLLSDMLRLLEGNDESLLVNVDLAPRLKTWAAVLGLSGIEKLKTALDDAYRLQTRNVNQQLGWEALAVNLLSGN